MIKWANFICLFILLFYLWNTFTLPKILKITKGYKYFAINFLCAFRIILGV